MILFKVGAFTIEDENGRLYEIPTDSEEFKDFAKTNNFKESLDNTYQGMDLNSDGHVTINEFEKQLHDELWNSQWLW